MDEPELKYIFVLEDKKLQIKISRNSCSYILFLSVILFSSQSPDDTGNYDNQCNVGINALPSFYFEGGYIDADAFFNANEGDCLSSDYLFVIYSEGGVELVNQNAFRDENGNVLIQDFNQYNCCSPISNNSGGNWGGWDGSGAGFNSPPGAQSCDCNFTVTIDSDGKATVTVNCNCTNEL